MTLDSMVEEIKKAETIVLLTHESPDGDAIGSTLALYIALKGMGKNVDFIMPEYSSTYQFLPQIEEVKKESKQEHYDLAISLDCGDIKRLNGFSKYFEEAKTTINIDHHSGNTMFADYNFVEPASPACAQTLIVVLEYLEIAITKEIGTCLLTGIITDTGGFKYPGITPETFEFVAELLKKGVNVSNVYRKALQVISRSKFELGKIAIDRIEFIEDGKITFMYVTKQDEELVHANIGDHEGIVEKGRDIEGVEVSIFLKEVEDGYKVSLRSNDYVNVADVCLMLGGGGHMRAAGCTLKCPFEQAKEKIIAKVREHIKS